MTTKEVLWFERIIEIAELRALSNHSLECPLTEFQAKRMKFLFYKYYGGKLWTSR